jgi:hypothetical protein
MIVYLSDKPEVGQNLVEVARILPPTSGRPGSIDSGKFAVFSGTFPRGNLNFNRGTYVELELRGRSTRCWIDDWDPQIYCSTTKCGDYGWPFGPVNMIDYLMLLAEFGLSNPGSVNKGCLDLVTDGVIDNGDFLAWDIASRLNMCPWVSDESMAAETAVDEALSSISDLETQNIDASLLIFGKPGISGQAVPASYLYPVGSDGTCRGDAIGSVCPVPPCEENAGHFVTDSDGNIYQINVELGLIRQDTGAIVVGPNVVNYQDNLVSIGFNNGEGPLLFDAAFKADDPNFVYVVPVQVDPQDGNCPYIAAAKLRLTEGGNYDLLRLYGKNPAEYSAHLPTNCQKTGNFVYEPDLQHLHEIEIDPYGNLFILSAQQANENNWILMYDEAIGNDSEVRVWLKDPNVLDPNLMISPTSMIVSSIEQKLYFASAVTLPEDLNDLTTEVYCFSVNRDSYPNLVLENIVEINCPEPVTDICDDCPQWCEPNCFVSVITSMAEDPGSGTLYVTGFTSPKFKEEVEWSYSDAPEFFITPEFFTTPVLAVVPPGSSMVEASEITDCDPILPLVLPLSIVWSGEKCGGADLTVDGEVNFNDLAVVADYWLKDTCAAFNNCGGADLEPPNQPDGDVDMKDLAILARYWSETGCLD